MDFMVSKKHINVYTYIWPLISFVRKFRPKTDSSNLLQMMMLGDNLDAADVKADKEVGAKIWTLKLHPPFYYNNFKSCEDFCNFFSAEFF
jgi:hypothetical protein